MKLIGLYIENFGGLHQYALDFSDGLTVIQEANGFGKTTLAEFIRAMFYGFPRKAKTLDKSRRQKYTPWQGGKFGGHLTFRLDGKDYRIERTFGATPKGDHFQLIDLSTNKKSDRFSEEIGLEIFGLDADSFERSTYMPQLREKLDLSTDGIRAKLGDLVEDTGDVGNFEKAITVLKAKRSSYIPYRGNGGIVGDAAGRISQIQGELDRTLAKEGELKSCREDLIALEQNLRENEDQLGTVRKEITATSEMTAVQAVHNQYEAMKARLEQVNRQLAELKLQYPGELPGEEELENAAQTADRRAILLAQNVTGPEDEAALRFLKEQEKRFANDVPSAAELENCRSMLENHQMLRAELKNSALTQAEWDQYREGKTMQDAGVLDEKRLERLAQNHRELDRVRNLLDNLEAPAEESAPVAQKQSPMGAILLAAGIVALVAGIVLMVLGQVVPGGIVLGLGVIGLIGGVFGTMKTMMAKELARQRQAQAASDRQGAYARKRTELEAQVRELESGLYRDLGRGDFSQAIEQLRLTRIRHLDLQEKMTRIQKQQQVLTEKIQETERKIGNFLGRYCDSAEPEGFYNLLTELQRTAEGYLRAQATVESWKTRKTRWEQELASCNEALDAFFRKHQLPVEGDLRSQLQKIRDDIWNWRALTKQCEALTLELENFRQEHGAALENPLPELTSDPETLKARENALLAEASGLTREILRKRQLAQELRNQLDRIPELQDQLDAFKIRKKEGQVTADLLDETMEFLQMAKDSLSSNYLGPIQRSFREYLGAMTKVEEKMLITGDLEIQLERQGQARELGYFSAGQVDAVMLCMRFALVDALFTEEKPFVILDDPFVNLDDAHTAQALELLQKLAQDRQIIYLVCNSSRTI